MLFDFVTFWLISSSIVFYIKSLYLDMLLYLLVFILVSIVVLFSILIIYTIY